MKTLTHVLFSVCFSAICSMGFGQETDSPNRTGFFVFHQNKVAMKDLATVNALQDSIYTPVLNEMVEEGKLLGWGQLGHAWGDEWNFNFYFITDNHRAFLDFWDAYIGKITEEHPTLMADTAPLIQGHKDNMYFARVFHPVKD